MILLLVFAGFVVGSISAVVTLLAGGSLLGAFGAYAVFGALGMVIAAFFVYVAPMLQFAVAPFSVEARPQRR